MNVSRVFALLWKYWAFSLIWQLQSQCWSFLSRLWRTCILYHVQLHLPWFLVPWVFGFFLWFHVPLSLNNHPVLFQIPIYCCSSFKYTFTNVGCNIVPYFQYSVVVCFTEELFGKKHVTVRESVPAVIVALIGFQVLDLKGKREKEKLTIRLPWS